MLRSDGRTAAFRAPAAATPSSAVSASPENLDRFNRLCQLQTMPGDVVQKVFSQQLDADGRKKLLQAYQPASGFAAFMPRSARWLHHAVRQDEAGAVEKINAVLSRSRSASDSMGSTLFNANTILRTLPSRPDHCMGSFNAYVPDYHVPYAGHIGLFSDEDRRAWSEKLDTARGFTAPSLDKVIVQLVRTFPFTHPARRGRCLSTAAGDELAVSRRKFTSLMSLGYKASPSLQVELVATLMNLVFKFSADEQPAQFARVMDYASRHRASLNDDRRVFVLIKADYRDMVEKWQAADADGRANLFAAYKQALITQTMKYAQYSGVGELKDGLTLVWMTGEAHRRACFDRVMQLAARLCQPPPAVSQPAWAVPDEYEQAITAFQDFSWNTPLQIEGNPLHLAQRWQTASPRERDAMYADTVRQLEAAGTRRIADEQRSD